MSEHRNGCTKCTYEEGSYPACWTDAEVQMDQLRILAMVTSEPELAPLLLSGDVPTEPERAAASSILGALPMVLSWTDALEAAKALIADGWRPPAPALVKPPEEVS